MKTPHLQSKTAAALLVVVVILAAGGILAGHLLTPKPYLKPEVAKQLSYGAFFPSGAGQAEVDRKSVTYNPANQVLTYSVKTTDQTVVSINEQPTPPSFVDVPEAFNKLVSSLNPYSSFDTINGTVHLTMPPQLAGSQSAVLNTKGTLLFVRPAHNLSEDAWRQLFNSLQIVR